MPTKGKKAKRPNFHLFGSGNFDSTAIHPPRKPFLVISVSIASDRIPMLANALFFTFIYNDLSHAGNGR